MQYKEKENEAGIAIGTNPGYKRVGYTPLRPDTASGLLPRSCPRQRSTTSRLSPSVLALQTPIFLGTDQCRVLEILALLQESSRWVTRFGPRRYTIGVLVVLCLYVYYFGNIASQKWYSARK